ncbi:MAG: hypothetical protein KGJ36_01550 [Acidobacteriota bacterium]|nr:hypothetical protein [Acidobacteriota bacterium]
MAVRAFDLTAPQSDRLSAPLPAPRRRQEVRRARQRWALVGLLSLIAPFAAALLVLGAAH